jgi:hypothetical protein
VQDLQIGGAPDHPIQAHIRKFLTLFDNTIRVSSMDFASEPKKPFIKKYFIDLQTKNSIFQLQLKKLTF